MLQQFHNTRNFWPDLLLQFGWEMVSEAQRALGICTLCSKTRQAVDRSPTNLLVGILQQFHNTRKCWLDLLLQFGWEAASEAQSAPGERGNTYFVLQDRTSN
jgi:hypothetical protein